MFVVPGTAAPQKTLLPKEYWEIAPRDRTKCPHFVGAGTRIARLRFVGAGTQIRWSWNRSSLELEPKFVASGTGVRWNWNRPYS